MGSSKGSNFGRGFWGDNVEEKCSMYFSVLSTASAIFSRSLSCTAISIECQVIGLFQVAFSCIN
jgi:hypothetical protein